MFFFFSNDPAPTEIYTLSLHDALPISLLAAGLLRRVPELYQLPNGFYGIESVFLLLALIDRKSTRLNSSHTVISYAVFCLKKKKIRNTAMTIKGSNRLNTLMRRSHTVT